MAVLTGVSPVLLVAELQRSVDYFSNASRSPAARGPRR